MFGTSEPDQTKFLPLFTFFLSRNPEDRTGCSFDSGLAHWPGPTMLQEEYYIAVHGGAGYHHPDNDKRTKRALRLCVKKNN